MPYFTQIFRSPTSLKPSWLPKCTIGTSHTKSKSSCLVLFTAISQFPNDFGNLVAYCKSFKMLGKDVISSLQTSFSFASNSRQRTTSPPSYPCTQQVQTSTGRLFSCKVTCSFCLATSRYSFHPSSCCCSTSQSSQRWSVHFAPRSAGQYCRRTTSAR